MPNIPDKTDNTGQYLSATELNPFKNSVQGVITDAGGTLIESDSLQFRQALNSYASIANFYIDTGTATEYVLNPQGAFKAPIDASTTWNGMLIRFRPTNNNTGIATLRLAGLNGGLPFNTLREDGTTIQVGDFSTTRDAILRYDSTASAFMLLTVPVPNASQTVAGIIKTSTTALVNAGNDDLTAITPFQLQAYIASITGNSRGTSGYTYLPNGLILNWGVTSTTVGNIATNTVIMNFALPFPTGGIHAISCVTSAEGGCQIGSAIISTTQASVTYANLSGGTKSFTGITFALGY